MSLPSLYNLWSGLINEEWMIKDCFWIKLPVPVLVSLTTLVNSKLFLNVLNGLWILRATFCERLTLDCGVLCGKQSSTP